MSDTPDQALGEFVFRETVAEAYTDAGRALGQVATNLVALKALLDDFASFFATAAQVVPGEMFGARQKQAAEASATVARLVTLTNGHRQRFDEAVAKYRATAAKNPTVES